MLTDINRKNMLDHIKINNYWTNSIKPFYQLARLDKPIGFFLLMWPCLWSYTYGLIIFSNTMEIKYIIIDIIIIDSLVKSSRIN